VNPVLLQEALDKNFKNTKNRSESFSITRRILLQDHLPSVKQDVFASIVSSHFVEEFYPPRRSLTISRASHSNPDLQNQPPALFFPIPSLSSRSLLEEDPEILLLQASQESSPNPQQTSEVPPPPSTFFGASVSDLFAMEGASSSSKPLSLEFPFSYSRGLLAGADSQLSDLRSKFLEILGWTVDALANPEENLAVLHLCADFLVARLQDIDFDVLLKLDLVTKIFSTLQWVEDTLVGQLSDGFVPSLPFSLSLLSKEPFLINIENKDPLRRTLTI